MAGHPLVSTMEVKRVGTFPVILVKLVTPAPAPPPPPPQLILSTMGGNVCFFGHNIAGGSGEQWDEPKG